MHLDERSASLLRRLQQSPISSMKDLTAQTGLSRRQIQYAFSKLNDWLSFHGYPLIRYDRSSGYSLPAKVREGEWAGKLTKKNFMFAERDRELLFSLMILLSQEELSVYHFQAVTGLSRNTVLKDLKRLRGKMKPYELELRYSKLNGYLLAGDSRKKRYMLERLIHEIEWGENGHLIRKFLWEDEEARMKQIRFELEKIETELKMTFTDERLGELASLFLATDQLIAKGGGLEADDSWVPFSSTKEYEQACGMVKSDAFLSPWDQTEILYATLHLLTMNRTQDHSPLQDDEKIKRVLGEVIQEFERTAIVHFGDKEQLSRELYIHFKPAYHRIQYGISVQNPMMERVKKVYPELFHLTRKSLGPLEKEIGHEVPDEEAAYFTIYFGVWMRRQGMSLDDRKKAIVVCPNGIGISSILTYTLKDMFPDILFLDVLSVRQMAEYPLAYDLVFSTVPMRTKAALFVVPPILEKEDRQQLRRKVMGELYGFTVEEDTSALLKIISRYADIREPKQLEQSLQSFLHAAKEPKFTLKEADKPMLEELLVPQTIQIQSGAANWQEAIRSAARPLIEMGTIEERYADAMIASIEANGPYVVITPGVAIPHARPEEGVRSLSMSVLKLDQPVAFAPDKQVSLIFILAAVDNESHLRALMQLTQLLNDPAHIEAMKKTEDPALLLEYIHTYSKEEEK